MNIDLSTIDFFETSPMPIIVLDLKLAIIKYNIAATSIRNSILESQITIKKLLPIDFRKKNTFQLTIVDENYTVTKSENADYVILYFELLSNEKKNIVENHEHILEALLSGVVLLDTNHKICYINAAMEKLLECSRANVLGIPAIEFAANESDAAWISTKMQERISGKSGVYQREITVNDKNKIVEIQSAPFKNSDGKIVGSIAVMNDVTEQNKNQKTLNQLSVFAQKTTNGIIITDHNGIIEWVIQSFVDITGYSKEEVIGHKPGSMLQGKDTDKETIKLFSDKLKTEKPFEIQLKNYTKKNVPFWAQMSITPMFDEAEKLINYMAVISDNTENNNITAQLIENGKKYRELVETCSNFIYKADANGNFTYLNAFGIAKMGYEKEEIIGMNFSELIVPEFTQQVIDFYKHQFTNRIKETYYEFPVFTKQGKKLWIGQNVQMYLENNRIQGFQAFANDITDKKRLENELNKQKELLDTILDSLPIVVFLKQKNGDHIFINNTIANPSTAELIENRTTFVKQLDYLDSEVWESKKAQETVEKIIHEGKGKYFIVGKQIIHTKSYEQPLLLGYVYDITDRKKVEEDLKKAKLKAEKSIAAKERFISIMSHEIRTPMNAVVGINNLLLQQPYLPEQREYFQATKTVSDSLLKILNNILDLSKLDAGMVILENKDLDLPKLIQEVLAPFKFKAAEKNIQLHTEIDSQIPSILRGDALKLHQILVNLVSNAMKFTHEGSVLVKVNLIEIISGKMILRFVVKDTGIGIAPDKLDSVFESYTQLNNHIANQYGGTGLGLTIAKSLIDLQGGDIDVESTVGIGTTFFFQLSFEASNFKELHEKEKIEYNLQGLRILLVEDNLMNQMIVQKFLEKKGVELYIANHGKEAIEILLKHPLNLVLMDLQMPVMDGYETVKYIRKKLKIPAAELPIVAMTAASGTDSDLKLTKSGFNGIITKPFEPENMYAIIAANTDNTAVPLLPKAIPVVEATVINLEYLKESAAGSMEFVKNMIKIFLNQTPEYLEEIKYFYDTKNWSKLQTVVHKMKPTMIMMGMNLRCELEEIEEMAKQKRDFEQMGKLLEMIYAQARIAFHDLQKELALMK